MKKIITIILTIAICSSISAAQLDKEKKERKPKQKAEKLELLKKELVQGADTLTDEFLDTVVVKKSLVVNDYSLVGLNIGAGLSRFMWNPRQEQIMVFSPVNVGITYTKYGKMFGMPFFAFKAGLFYTQEGYEFEYNEEYNYTYKIEGAEKAVLDVVEIPLMFQFHFDTWNFKFLAEIGCFGGYRLGIQRFPGKTGNVTPELEFSFTETDNRLDYGIKGGAGFALVFDPLEFHIMAYYKHSLSSLYEPDHYSQYYYRYAYPANIVVSAGVYFQLSKRTGKTKSELRKQAKSMVYGDNLGQSR